MLDNLVIDIDQLKQIAQEKLHENDLFKAYIENFEVEKVDELVFNLNQTVAPKISCTNCGNCCKSLMVNINEVEADNLANHLQISRTTFDEKYIEKGSSMMILNSIPCHFLENDKCTVYEHRFEGCKEFPALHIPNFTKRLFTIFMHYDRCPIIFNVVEQLKNKLNFKH